MAKEKNDIPNYIDAAFAFKLCQNIICFTAIELSRILINHQ